MSTPTLEELFEKFRYLLKDPKFQQHSQSFERYFRLVASGELTPIITDNHAVLAAQCVIIILEHVKQMEQQG